MFLCGCSFLKRGVSQIVTTFPFNYSRSLIFEAITLFPQILQQSVFRNFRQDLLSVTSLYHSRGHSLCLYVYMYISHSIILISFIFFSFFIYSIYLLVFLLFYLLFFAFMRLLFFKKLEPHKLVPRSLFITYVP